MSNSTRFEVYCFGIISALVLVGLFLSITDIKMFEHVYVLEDGLIEWGTVLLLLFICFTAWIKMIKAWNKTTWWFRFCLFFLGFLCFFGAGEEISWGQRIFRWMAPQFFFENNTQQETTLHNLVVGGVRLNKVVFGTGIGIGMGFYLLALPFLYETREKLRKLVDAFAIPLPQIHQILFFVLIFIAVTLVPSGKKGELYEFTSVFLCWLILLFPKNKSIYH